jgi:3',5'-cyclic AMP phosphodiesterase CpdA
MKRREFIKRLTLALAAGWTLGRLYRPGAVAAGDAPSRLALLADSHLKDGNPARPEAQALVRAVVEVKALRPRPDLILFAGDLAHDGHPRALALGKEILADLPVPVMMVKGEGDGGPESAHWRRLFGHPWFLRSHHGMNLLGLYTNPCRSPHGLSFALGQTQIAWLAGELARLDPAAPLVVLSHAPLAPIFRPWGQWTRDGAQIAPLLARFPNAVYLHGHVHQAVPGSQSPVAGSQYPGIDILGFLPENRKPKTENRLSLPATAWPLPSPLEGTPAALSPGFGPRGCGWAAISLGAQSWQFQPQVWQA